MSYEMVEHEAGECCTDPLLEEADRAHEEALRRLDADVRLADRFFDLVRAARSTGDPLFYALRKRVDGPRGEDRPRPLAAAGERTRTSERSAARFFSMGEDARSQ